MKFLRISCLVVLITGFLGFTSCGPGGGGDPTIEEAQLKALTIPAKSKTSQVWALSQATLDGVDKMTDYPGFKIEIKGVFTEDGGTYDYEIIARPIKTVAKPGLKSPWPKDLGKWKFGIPASAQVIREPGDAKLEQDMAYEVTNTQLILTFTYTGEGYSTRTSNVSGEWIMKFTPQ